MFLVRRFALLLVPLSLTACTSEESTNPAPPPDLSSLEVPQAGAGYQFESEETVVASGDEEQDCYFFKVSELAKKGGLDASKPVNLHRVQIAQRDGSHHMNIFRVRTIKALDPANGVVQKAKNGVGECFKSANWADWPLVANTQQEGQVDWTYPDGVANVFEPDEWLMLQTHYVNASTQKTANEGKVRVNFWTVAASEVKAELGTLFATKQSIRVCQHNPSPTFEGSCQINSPNPVTIIGANAHFHSRGRTFEMYKWDGMGITTPPAADRFYTSNAWNDPPMAHSPELEMSLPMNGGVWYRATYEWAPPDPSIGCDGLNKYDADKHMTPAADQDCCYTFGPIVEKNEHCNIFVYYYPKQDNVNCF